MQSNWFLHVKGENNPENWRNLGCLGLSSSLGSTLILKDDLWVSRAAVCSDVFGFEQMATDQRGIMVEGENSGRACGITRKQVGGNH